MYRHYLKRYFTLLFLLAPFFIVNDIYTQQIDLQGSSISKGFFSPDSSTRWQAEEMAKDATFGFLIVHSNIIALDVTSSMQKLLEHRSFIPRSERGYLEWYRVPLVLQYIYFNINGKEIATERMDFSESVRVFYYRIIDNELESRLRRNELSSKTQIARLENPPQPNTFKPTSPLLYRSPIVLLSIFGTCDKEYLSRYCSFLLELKLIDRLSISGGYIYTDFRKPITVNYETFSGLIHEAKMPRLIRSYNFGARFYFFGSYPSRWSPYASLLYSHGPTFDGLIGFNIFPNSSLCLGFNLGYRSQSFSYEEPKFNFYGNSKIKKNKCIFNKFTLGIDLNFTIISTIKQSMIR